MTSFILTGLLTFVLSYLGVLALRRWAQNGHAIDLPNARSSHTRPTPRGGGLLIVVLTLTGLTVLTRFESAYNSWEAWPYIVGGVLIASAGWIDDLRELPFWLRIIVQSLCAILIIITLGYVNTITLPLFDDINLGWAGIPLTFLLIVGMVNAYNFMDGIDGLAGLQAVVGGLAWMAIPLALSVNSKGWVGVLVAATSLGFLIHNWSPARIFMGDVGSTFLGFTFAVLIVVHGATDSRLAILGLLILWPFILDTSFTILRRLGHRENIFAAHRSHLYQRLVICGYSHSFVTLLYAGLSVIGILLGTSWYIGLPYMGIILVTTISALAIGLCGFVLISERRMVKVGST